MRLAYLSDLHFGKEQNIPAYQFAVKIMRELNVDEVFLGGDVFDAVALGSYTKRPDLELTLAQELEEGYGHLEYLRERLPYARMRFLPGNHESRLVRYIWNKAPALYGLKQLSYKNLYGLDDLDIEYCDEGEAVEVGKLMLIHGHEIKTGGANPAQSALLDGFSSVLFGHVHRASTAQVRSLRKVQYIAYSNPCLCSLSPGYRTAPNWSNGFSVVDFTSTGFFKISQAVFWMEDGKYRTMFDGIEFHE